MNFEDFPVKSLRTDTVPALLWAAGLGTTNLGGGSFLGHRNFSHINCLLLNWTLKQILYRSPEISLCESLFSSSLSCELHCPWSPGLPGLNIIFSTHGVYFIPPRRDHCSLFCHNQYLPKDYFIYFKHCYRWKSKSHSYSFIFTRCRNFLVFIHPPLQYTKDILAFQFYPARATFGSRFKSTNMLESIPVP